MRCGRCRHEWHVTAEWLERFDQALEGCPVCGTDCRSEGRPVFCAEPESRWHDDTAVRESYWYHSSAHENWPDKDFDPAADLTVATKRRFEAMGLSVEDWAARQKSKALHVGTYEAAIENTLRRLDDQRGALDQFYLYRVQLTSDCVIEPDVQPEPTDWVGNAYLAEVVTSGSTVLRYVNVHEDPSSVSLALEPVAIRAVQSIPIPLTIDAGEPSGPRRNRAPGAGFLRAPTSAGGRAPAMAIPADVGSRVGSTQTRVGDRGRIASAPEAQVQHRLQ